MRASVKHCVHLSSQLLRAIGSWQTCASRPLQLCQAVPSQPARSLRPWASAMAATQDCGGPAPSAAPPAAPAAGVTADSLTLTPEVKAQFDQQLQLTALRIPKQKTSHYMKLLTKHLFNKPRLRNVLKDPEDDSSRLLLLDEGISNEDLAVRQVDDAKRQTVAELVRADGLSVTTAHVAVSYAYWTVQTVLRRLLPDGLEVPSAFESVGHIAHLNLRNELLPYKHLIGQVILDKNPSLKTVVNKVGSIENEFRVFQMEVLAGEDSTETEVRQHGARFRLDFRKVYWNSRLEREHQRLVDLFQPGEVVLDAMAGIGPFAIPAAHKGCKVYANDLNPASFQYLCTNIQLNHVAGKVLPFNLDGREFMRAAAAGQLDLAAAAAVVPSGGKPGKRRGPPGQQQQQQQQQQQGGPEIEAGVPPRVLHAAEPTRSSNGTFNHVVMNLPAAAVDFLDALHGAFCPRLWQAQPLPLVHVYTFAKGQAELEGLLTRVESRLGGALDGEPTQHIVRDVAPNKIMVCLSFRVPEGVAFASKRRKTGVMS